MKIAVVRGKFLNRFEMQFFEPLAKDYDLVAFGSKYPYHDRFIFPVVKLPGPMDLPEFPYKMPVLNRLFTDAHVLFGLEERLRGFDLVHSAETYYSYTYQALRAKKMGYVGKVIATVLENIPFNNEGIPGRRERKAFARKNLDHFIALTERTRNALILEGADESKITVLPHFIDTAVFHPNSYWPSGLGVRKKVYTVLFAGRLEKEKGIFDILAAAGLLIADPELKRFRLNFVFVGTGSELGAMRSLEKKLGIAGFVTHKSGKYGEMPAEYRQADVYVAPSTVTATWQEQYNTTLLEAQSSGLPIVTTYSGGIPENVGESAVLVPPSDPTGLYLAVKSFLLHPKKRYLYGKKARDRALTVHDKRIGAKKLAEIYEKVMGGKPENRR